MYLVNGITFIREYLYLLRMSDCIRLSAYHAVKLTFKASMDSPHLKKYQRDRRR